VIASGKTVAVVGDGAVGLLAVLSAKQMGATRIIAMSRHAPRQKLARYDARGLRDWPAERAGLLHSERYRDFRRRGVLGSGSCPSGHS
jgi:threonine dehydrogenase-like Zn-dependent dehydrogenase